LPGNLSTYNTMFIIVGIVTLQYRYISMLYKYAI
jgi:hypothetical protein